MMASTANQVFGKRATSIGIGLAAGLIVGAAVASITGNMGWWIWIGMTIGTCIGVACAMRLK